jgi:hypothetical protein
VSESSKPILKDPQYIIAIGVTVISLCALIVSAMQTQIMQEERELMREYSRASVWPRLELGISKGHNPDDGSIRHFVISLTNSGVGPAIITDAKVSYNGKAASDWWHLFQIQQIPDSIEAYISNRSFNNQIIKIGETVNVLNLDANLPLANAFFEKMHGLSYEIYYESIYGEKWKYDGETTIEIENYAPLPDEEQFDR